MTINIIQREKEIQDLYLYFLELKSQNSLEKIQDVVKGIINECDFLVKEISQKNSVSDQLSGSSQFYWVYGNVLKEYAFILVKQGQEEECRHFLEFARDQFELGLELVQTKSTQENVSQLDFVLEILMIDLQELKELEIKELKNGLTEFNKKQLIRIGMGVKDYANFITENQESRMEWNDFAISILQSQNDQSLDENLQDMDASKEDIDLKQEIMDGIAQCFLSKANFYAEEEEQDDTVCSNADKALEFLKKGLEYAKKGLDLGEFAQGLATRGEILIYLSDINAQLENEKESELYYEEAVNDLKKCHALDATVLPQEFFELI